MKRLRFIRQDIGDIECYRMEVATDFLWVRLAIAMAGITVLAITVAEFSGFTSRLIELI